MFEIFKLLILVVLFSTTFLQFSYADYNRNDYFKNFICDNPQTVSSPTNCKITGITSESELTKIFTNLGINSFKYYICTYSYDCYYENYNKVQRKDITDYEYFTFENSQFAKFPSGMFPKLNNMKELSASNVNMSEINRDDLKSFKSLRKLDLSYNNIKTLGNVVLLHLESLVELNLSYNQIESIHVNAFDECSKKLRVLNLSHNKLKQIYENILDIIGQHLNYNIYLNHNEIEEIIPSESSGNLSRKFSWLSMSNNKLKSFNYNCTEVKRLLLDSNVLEEFSIGSCKIDFLNISKNSITEIDIQNITTLFASDIKNLSKFNVNVDKLIKLEIRNAPVGIITFELLKNATKLEYLDATNTFLGALKIDSLSDLTSLQTLKLSNTGLSHIDYGMFSHQSELTELDISNNNLGSIDIKMLTSLKSVDQLDVSGNNLSSLEHANEIKKIFPILSTVGIADNNWNCTYLATLYKIFEENSILIQKPLTIVKSSSNVMGIGCITSSQLKIKPLDADKVNDEMANKMNEIIVEINAMKDKNNNVKYDGDIIRAELFHIQKELLDIKSKVLKDQIMMNVTAPNDGKGVDITVIKNMMEQLNNFTLEKQKLATDQLQLKINEIQIQLKMKEIELDKYVQKSSLKEILSDKLNNNNNNNNVRYEYIKSSDGSENKTNILLIVLITSLAIIAVIFGYTKLKNLLYRRSETMSVRARSTNTINTTVELPFND